MTIRSGVCNSYKREILRGEHRPEHVYKVALYTYDADLSDQTTRYQKQGEVVGMGYPSGGVTLTGFRVTGDDDGQLRFNSQVIPKATIHADGGLIYNATINKAVAVFAFGETIVSTNGPFYIDMPAADEAALVTIA